MTRWSYGEIDLDDLDDLIRAGRRYRPWRCKLGFHSWVYARVCHHRKRLRFCPRCRLVQFQRRREK